MSILRHWWGLVLQSRHRHVGNRPTVHSETSTLAPNASAVDRHAVLLAGASRAASVAKRVGRQALKWQERRRVRRNLHFVCWRLRLPSRAQVRGRAAEEADLCSVQTAETASQAIAKNPFTARVIVNFQQKVRDLQRQRQRVRHIEFDAWYKDCKVDRGRLTVINAAFLVVLAAFTMMICLLLSAAFDDDQCLLWVQKVMQSIAMQVLVTGPLIGLVVLCVKIFVSWLLLRCNARARNARRLAGLEDQVQQTRHRRSEIGAQLRRFAAAEASVRRIPAEQQEEVRLRRWGLMRSLQRITATEVVLEARKKKAQFAAGARKNRGLKRQKSLSQPDREPNKSDETLRELAVVTAWSEATHTIDNQSARATKLQLQRIVPQMCTLKQTGLVGSSETSRCNDDVGPVAGFSVRSRTRRKLRTVPQFTNCSASASRRRKAIRSRLRRDHSKMGKIDSDNFAKNTNPTQSGDDAASTNSEDPIKIEIGTRQTHLAVGAHATIIDMAEVEL